MFRALKWPLWINLLALLMAVGRTIVVIDVDCILDLQSHSDMFGVPDPLFNPLVDVDFLDAHKYGDDFHDP